MNNKLILAASLASLPFLSLAEAMNSSPFYGNITSGYAITDWENSLPSSYTITKNKNGGFSWGGSIGYNLRPWLALELGSYKIPTTKVTTNGTIKEEIYYLAGRMSHELSPSLSIYNKAGLGLQNTRIKEVDYANSNTTLGPFFGVGINYNIAHNLSSSLELDQASGHSDHDKYEFSANPTLVLAGINYRF